MAARGCRALKCLENRIEIQDEKVLNATHTFADSKRKGKRGVWIFLT